MNRLLRLAAIDLRPLRHRDFSLLLAGQLVSYLGTELTVVALPFQVFQLSHSPFALGLLGLVQLGPVLACAFWGGALADAADRRRMVLATEAAFALISALLAVNAVLAVAIGCSIYAGRYIWVRWFRPESGVPDLQQQFTEPRP